MEVHCHLSLIFGVEHTKLRDELADFRFKEASVASKYEVLLAEIEQVRKTFRSQEHVWVLYFLIMYFLSWRLSVYLSRVECGAEGFSFSWIYWRLELICIRISKERLEVQSVDLFQTKEECSELKVRVFPNNLTDHLVNSIHVFYSP